MNDKNIEKKDIIISLGRLFEEVSGPLRGSLIGSKIDKILSKYYDEISNEQIAQALITQYGSETLLAKNKIFERIVFGLDQAEINKLAQFLNVAESKGEVYENVADQISKQYDKFLEYYNQSDYFKIKKEEDNRITSEVIELEYEENLTSLGYPHPYQNLVKLELEECIKKSSGKYRALVVMPTGSGKTRTAVEFMIDFIRSRKKSNILWIVESPNLSEQSLQTFFDFWKLRGDRLLKVHRCFNSYVPQIDFTNGTNIIFGAFDKMSNLRDNEDIFFNELKSSTDLMIIDEAHFSLAETYEKVISDIEQNSDNIIKIGLTATPMRSNDTEFYNLKSYFNSNIIDFKDDNNNIIDDPLKYLQEKHYLASLNIEYLSIPDEEINEASREFNDKVIERIQASLDEKKQIIVFAMSKDHAVGLNILLQDKGVKSECIIGDTSTNDRINYFNKFKTNINAKKDGEPKIFELNVLINYNILATGIDLPRVDELYLLRKFGNETTAMQVLGRALRGKKNGGNIENKVISVKGNKAKIANESELYNLIKNMY
jgi:DNA repair protein RadD